MIEDGEHRGLWNGRTIAVALPGQVKHIEVPPKHRVWLPIFDCEAIPITFEVINGEIELESVRKS